MQAGAPDGDGCALGVQRGAMGFTIDAGGHAADDADASAGESSGQLGGDLFAVGRYATRAHDGDGALVVGAGQVTLDINQGRRVGDLSQLWGICRVVPGDGASAVFGQRLQGVVG